jgi:hypothetical protein
MTDATEVIPWGDMAPSFFVVRKGTAGFFTLSGCGGERGWQNLLRDEKDFLNPTQAKGRLEWGTRQFFIDGERLLS